MKKGQKSLFPDADLVSYTAETYGVAMAGRLDEILALDPENETGFANSIRRSLTREIARKAEYNGPIPRGKDSIGI